MSAESDAALNELQGLKADLEALNGAISAMRSAAVAAASTHDADRQALIDLQAQVAAIRADLASVRSANGLQN